MTAAIVIILAIALCVACWFLFDLACNLAVAERNLDARQRVIDDLRPRLSAATEDLATISAALSESDRIRHEVAASAMRGAPAVWFARPAGMDNPAADAGYWRVMIAGAPHDFTTEQVAIAAKRAAHFTNRKPATSQ